MSIYTLWIYTGSVLECSGWSARVVLREISLKSNEHTVIGE